MIKNQKSYNFIIMLICLAVLICIISLCADKAFRYDTKSPAVSSVYDMADGEKITQAFTAKSDMRLYGVKIRFDTHDQVNSGKIMLSLVDRGNVIGECSIDESYITDDVFHECDFGKAVNITEGHDYKITISNSDSGSEDRVGVYVSENGVGLSSSINNIQGELCYKLNVVHTSVKRAAIWFSSIMLILFALTAIKLFGVKTIRNSQIIIVTICLAMLCEISTYDLFKNIKTDVEVKSYGNTNSWHEIAGGENWESSIDGMYSPFDGVELFVKGQIAQTAPNLTIRLTDHNGTEYVNRKVKADDIIFDDTYGCNAVFISSYSDKLRSFPQENYNIEIDNAGTTKIDVASSGDLVDVSLTKSTLIGYVLSFILLSVIFSYLFIIWVAGRKRIINPETFFILSVCFLGPVYLIIFTPWNVPDIGAHFQGTYRIANILMGHGIKSSWIIRQDDLTFFQEVFSDRNTSIKDYLGVIYNLHPFVKDGTLVPWPNPDTRMEYYSALCYLPGAIGIVLARILRLGTVPMIYLGRIFTLLTYVITGYYAIKKAPLGKWIFSLVSLMPVCMMYSGSMAYDTMVIISTVCFTACILNAYYVKNRKSVLECALWAFIIGAVKGGGYLTLLPLAFVLIEHDLKDSIKRIIPIIAAGGVSVVLFDVIIPSGVSFFMLNNGATGNMSTSYGLSHPLIYFDMLTKTVIDNYVNLIIEMGGTSLAQREYVIPSVIIMSLTIVCLIVSIFESDKASLAKWSRVPILMALFLTFYFTPIMLLSYTPVNSEEIAGLQGRYLLPTLPLILILLSKFRLNKSVADIKHADRIAIIHRSQQIFSLLSVIVVYYMMRLYFIR